MIEPDIADLISRISDFWDFHSASRVMCGVFISRKSLSPIFFKINFDNKVIDTFSRADFVYQRSGFKIGYS